MFVLHVDMVLDLIVLLKILPFSQNQAKSIIELQAKFITLVTVLSSCCLQNGQREVTLGQVCPNVSKIDLQLSF